MSGAGGWGQTERSRKVMESSRDFVSGVRERMRPKHYTEVTQEEREKSGRKIRLPSKDARQSKRKSFCKPTYHSIIHGLVITIVTVAILFAGGPLSMSAFMVVVFIFVVFKSIWEGHHPRTPKVSKDHIRLKVKKP
jgi:hypothetical protein